MSCPDGIQPDADIAGIGVRSAIYIQAAFWIWPSLIPVTIDMFHLPSPPVMKLFTRIRTSMWSLLLTGAALLITAFIKAANGELSPYHAVIILNLSWIIFFSAYISRITAIVVFVYWNDPDNKPEVHALKEYILLVGQLIGTGALGIMLFHDVDAFARGAECPNDTVLWFFGSYSHLVAPGIRRFWLGIYSIAVIPYLNVLSAHFIWFMCLFGVRTLYAFLTRGAKWRLGNSAVTVGAMILPVLAIVLLIVSTEKTIQANPVASGEREWGFGQILALLLLIAPVYDVIQDIRELMELYRTRNSPYHDQDDTGV